MATAAAVALAVTAFTLGSSDGSEPETTLAAASRPADAVPRFAERGRRAGLTPPPRPASCSANAAGAALADVDGDGHLDLFASEPVAGGRLWLGDGEGVFRDATARAKLPRGRFTGASFADYDNDGDADLYLTALGPNRLLANDGRGRFLDVTLLSGIGDDGVSTSASWSDMDRDGDLDLYVTNGDNCGRPAASPDRLYRNTGDGRFTDATALLPAGASDGIGLAAAWVDHDRDGHEDLYLANDHLGFRGNELLRNDPSGGFAPVGERTRAALEVSSMGVAVADLDGDGRLDLAVSDEGLPHVLLARGGRFERARLTAPSGGGAVTWGLAAQDFDNDGAIDLFAASGAMGLRSERRPDLLYLGDGAGGFAEAGQPAGVADPGRARGVAAGDVNEDGLMDLVVGRLGERPLLFIGRGSRRGARAHWLAVRLRGTRSARDACGARVELTSGRQRQLRHVDCSSGSARVLHFGLGRAAGPVTLRVSWPSGLRRRLVVGRLDRRIVIAEPRGTR